VSEGKLREGLGAVAALRVDLDETKQRLADAEAALHDTPEWERYEEMRGEVQAVNELLSTLLMTVKYDALSAYQATGAKQPESGVTIKMYSVLKYDLDTAEDWCRENAPTLLSLDVKRFEKAAKTLPGAPVEIEQEPRATIASDLSAYLEQGA
jgi:hypothetical protein